MTQRACYLLSVTCYLLPVTCYLLHLSGLAWGQRGDAPLGLGSLNELHFALYTLFAGTACMHHLRMHDLLPGA